MWITFLKSFRLEREIMEKLFFDEMPIRIAKRIAAMKSKLGVNLQPSLTEQLARAQAKQELINIMPKTVPLEGDPTDLLCYTKRRVDGYAVWYDEAHRTEAFEALGVRETYNVFDSYCAFRHNITLRELVGEITPNMMWLTKVWAGNPYTSYITYYTEL